MQIDPSVQTNPDNYKILTNLVIPRPIAWVRPGRWQPRVLKRRMKLYDLMNRQRREYPEPPPAEELAA